MGEEQDIDAYVWNFLEEGTAVLNDAADASQFLEGDKYPTSSLVVPMTYKLMATSSDYHDVKFLNRAGDEFNDESLNPVKVPHTDLTDEIQIARSAYHQKLIDRFDTDVPRDVKQFWLLASICDPRFKKLKFKHDGMLKDPIRERAFKWFTTKFNKKYKGKVMPAPLKYQANISLIYQPMPDMCVISHLSAPYEPDNHHCQHAFISA